jgi:hypothetical protein
MGFIKYTRTDIHTIATVLSDIIHFSSEDSFTKKKIVDLYFLRETCNDEAISPESLNKKLHEILGSGLELYLLVVVPLIQIPKMINIYKNPPYDSIIKLRLQIGK